MITDQEFRSKIKTCIEEGAAYKFPLRLAIHPDPTCQVLYIKDANGREIATLYDDWKDSRPIAALFILLANKAHEVHVPLVDVAKPVPVVTREVESDIPF